MEQSPSQAHSMIRTLYPTTESLMVASQATNPALSAQAFTFANNCSNKGLGLVTSALFLFEPLIEYHQAIGLFRVFSQSHLRS